MWYSIFLLFLIFDPDKTFYSLFMSPNFDEDFDKVLSRFDDMTGEEIKELWKSKLLEHKAKLKELNGVYLNSDIKDKGIDNL